MSFRDFVTSRLFRRRLLREFARNQDIKPPANPSRRHIDKLVRRLLDKSTAHAAHRELSMIGPAAVPSLAVALVDPRYHRAEWPQYSPVPAPLESVLDLLVPHGPQHVLAAAAPFVTSPSKQVRKTTALHLASFGRTETLPALATLLQDPDGYVRSYVCTGVERAVSEGRTDPTFRNGAYDLLLAQCDQDWNGTTNEQSARAVVALDPARAAADFANGPWLSRPDRNAWHVLEACNRAKIPLPEPVTRPLLAHALARAVGDNCYPHQYLAAAALESLTLSTQNRAKPLLDAALHHDHPGIQEAAARGLVTLAGLEDPVSFVLDRLNETSLAALSHPQRVVYHAFTFDAEVCNGGLMQFFANSSGDHAPETLDALRELVHPAATTALTSAMAQVGPAARQPDRERRLTAFEGRYDPLQSAFDPLERAYYTSKPSLRRQWLLYAAKHPEHFRL